MAELVSQYQASGANPVLFILAHPKAHWIASLQQFIRRSQQEE